MAEFKGAISYYGNANNGSMTVPLSSLSVSEGDTVLLVWRVGLWNDAPNVPATPDGWELAAEGLGFWSGDSTPFRAANVYRHDAEGALDDLSVPLASGQFITGYALVLTLAEGEELGGWRTGMRREVGLNDPVGLDEASEAGQTFVLTGFEHYGIS